MISCVDFLTLPYQTKQGQSLKKSDTILPDGAVALLNFAGNIYVIGGRSFNNPDLAVTVRWADRHGYLNGANGIDTLGGRTRADLLPGIYDLVKVDPFGGEIELNVIVKEGAELIARAGEKYVQVVYAFPAGTKTLAELEELIMPVNVQSDWDETDESAASFIKGKKAFATETYVLESVTSGPIGAEIDERIGVALIPAFEAIDLANDTAAAALEAANRPFRFYDTGGPHDAVAGERIYCDTTAEAIVIVLPLTPVDGNSVDVYRDGANAVTFDRNGETIAGLVDDMTIDTDKTMVRMTYAGGDWHVERGDFV